MVQFFINISLGLGLGFLWIRIMRPAKDDPRLSRGLQLLQSKIAILEDLSDRTDNQVKHMSLLLEEKAKFVQRQIEAAQEQVQHLANSMQKSHEVAKIFQDKIPHEEIIERQNTIKYVRAAQMAFQGASLEEIEQAVDIPRSELEFIVKVNREKLMFNSEQLPPWIQYELEQTDSQPMIDKAYREAFKPAPAPSTSLSKIGEEFRKAVAEMRESTQAAETTTTAAVEAPIQNTADLSFEEFPGEDLPAIPTAPQKAAPTSAPTKNVIKGTSVNSVRPYTFPRIELKSNKPG